LGSNKIGEKKLNINTEKINYFCIALGVLLSIFMKRVFLLFLFITYCLTASSQDSLQLAKFPKNSIELSFTDVLGWNISINYCRFITKKSAIELMAGYQFPMKKQIDPILIFRIEDPFYIYDAFKVQFGYRFCFGRLYTTPTLFFKYGYFNKLLFVKYEDEGGDAFDVDYVISRYKTTYGIIEKTGLIIKIKRIFMDFYFGIGIKDLKFEEAIYAKYDFRGSLINANYPIRSSSWKLTVAIQTGINIGLRF
jgi:hypothetical protein